MLSIKGKYNEAKVFTNNIDAAAIKQVQDLCNNEALQSSRIRIMPDVHAGAGCTIGTTMTIEDKVIPNMVGVDIGCGMEIVELGNIEIDYALLDEFIRENIPSGFDINKEDQINFREKIQDLQCYQDLPKPIDYYNRGLGSLGGGNHFSEVDEDDEGNKYLIIHSGSRKLGNDIASYYQDAAYKYQTYTVLNINEEKHKIIDRLTAAGRQTKIQAELKKLYHELHGVASKIDKGTSWLEKTLMKEYLHDMNIAQNYASLNRKLMSKKIVEKFLKKDIKDLESWETVHNYIDTTAMILRKGAVSAKEGEKLLIPINMRDGCIIATGLGNEDWNYSAPHGAGRLMSRSKASESLKLDRFQHQMKGIYTTSVVQSTLDEAPDAYKPIDEIVGNIQLSVVVNKIIKPRYNFKSS